MSTAALKSVKIRREFLGWNQPALPEAARRLGDRYRCGDALDLENVIVVVPGQRAGRRLQELLAFLAEEENLLLTPPEVVTEGKLPEMLYTPKRPFATEIVQDLAWAETLRALPTERRRHVVPHPPPSGETGRGEGDALRWLELGRMLRRLHVELAADALDFAAVLAVGGKLANFPEARRWATLAELQRCYLDLLDKRQLWDIQTARLKAIEFGEPHTDREIVLLGTVDLNLSLRQMLDQVAERVAAYIVAPEELADRFDEYGCLAIEAWRHTVIDLRDEQLCQVDGPEDQADAVSHWLVELGGRYRKDEVAIGVPDETLVPQLQRQIEQHGVRGRWVEGVRLAKTAPYQLLAAAVQFAGRRRYDDLARLLRHPDLEDWLTFSTLGKIGTSLPAQLDEFYNAHLPSYMTSSGVRDNNEDWPTLAPALRHIEKWLDEAAGRRPVREWGNVFRRILADVYAVRRLNRDKPDEDVLYRTIQHILTQCDQLRLIPDGLDTVLLPAGDAFQLVLESLSDKWLPPAADPDAVEILGWLELPLDDSRALIVTSFNEGAVPKSAGAEAFLPDRLRRELGLLHNERRYARDAYAASVLCHSREDLRLVFARRDPNNDPLQPSRLLFACPDEALVRRARRFFGERQTAATPRRLLLAAEGNIRKESVFKEPAPILTGRKLERISVTRFKSYLACPYRYYLRHVRNLNAIDDSAPELDGGAFGSLLHSVLASLGHDDGAPRDSAREGLIFEFLAERLEELALKFYGADQRRASIHLQLEQARLRLKAFASAQANLVREGWRILHTENSEDMRDELCVDFEVDGEAITLVGRIDRIDIHEAKGAIRILDYKTADTAKTPDKTHREGGEWVDLQLPLYRHLCSAALLKTPVAPVGRICDPSHSGGRRITNPSYNTGQIANPSFGVVELGYFNLPKKLDETKIELAQWDAAVLDDADREARDVIRKLRAEIYEPITRPAPNYSEEFAAICLDNVFSPPAIPDNEDGNPA